MKILVVEPHADGLLDFALRAKAQDHQVRYHLAGYDPVKAPVGRGLVERVADWRGSMRWADLVILGSHRWAPEIDGWQKHGVPIIGAGSAAWQWELDRLQGMLAFKRAGIAVPPYRQCASLDEAIAYVDKRGEGMAVKPCGDVTDKSLTFVAKTPEEMLWRLGRWKKEKKRFPAGLILQDRVEGVEFAVSAWFGPGGFARGWEENFEEKRLLAGGIGPNCGEAGTVLRIVERSKLADKVLKPLQDQLSRTGYVGNVDVNCIIDDDGSAWPLEFTVRFGYPAINIELQLHGGDPLEFLIGLASGTPPSTRRMDAIALGVVMALPPYPFGHEKAAEVVGVPIWGLTPAIEDMEHLCNVQQAADGQLMTAGSYVLVSVGTGDNVVAARRQAHRAMRRLALPADPLWRNDIGGRLRAELPRLQKHGYAVGVSYSSA